MSGHRKWSAIRGERTPEQDERVAAGVAATRVIMRLSELRSARGATQNEIGRRMDVSQAYVSQIESKEDMYLSTLAKYARALDGELQVRIVFPDTEDVDLAV